MRNDHTFVICAYKESPYLETCILSLKKQTVQSKIILITSTWNAFIGELAKKYDISVFTHDDGGIGKDWNFALECSDTKYVTLAHQDDVYFKNYTEFILESFDKDLEGLIAFSDYAEIRDNQVKKYNINLMIKKGMLWPIRLFSKSKILRRRVLSFGNAICCPAVTYNREKLNEFLFNTELSTNLDWLAWEEISNKEGSFLYVPKCLMGHRIHENSETSNTIGDNRRDVEDLMILKKFWPDKMAKIIFHFYKQGQKSNNLK